MSPHSHYPSLSKSKRNDALVPDPQEFDFSDPDQTKATCQSAEGRIDLFERATTNEKSN